MGWFVRHRAARGFTLVELMVVVIIVGVLAAAAVPIYAGHTRRAVASEALAGLGAIRSAERVYYMEHGAYLAVAVGNIGNTPTDSAPGLGLDFDQNTYFNSYCFRVNLNARYGFISTCTGSHRRNTAPRAADAADVTVRARGNGQLRISYDGGTTFTKWE